MPGFREDGEQVLKYRLGGTYFERLTNAIAEDPASIEDALTSIDHRIEFALAE